MSTLHPIPEFWFERLNKRFRLPTWAAAILFGTGPFALLGLITAPVVPADVLLASALFSFGLSVAVFYTGKYLRRRVETLMSYAHEMMTERSGTAMELNLSKLSSTRMIGLVWLVIDALTVPLFTIGQTNGTFESNLIGELPYAWSNIVLATFFWSFGYSMYAISKIGSLPLTLKPYTQDRTLGLRPFASTSLSFTIIYLAIATTLVVVITLGGAIPVYLALLWLALYPVGLLLFLLPLWSLHRKLVEAKVTEFRWLEPRATSILQRLKAEQSVKIDQNTVYELAAIEKIERDISRIHSWPFDLALLARLLTIVILPLVLTVIARELIVVFLGR